MCQAASCACMPALLSLSLIGGWPGTVGTKTLVPYAREYAGGMQLSALLPGYVHTVFCSPYSLYCGAGVAGGEWVT